METSFIIFIVFAVAALIWSINYYASGNGKDNINLKEYYEQCLESTDKRVALNAGRAYYRSLRKDGLLKMQDELAIANDLSTMNIINPNNSL